MKCIKCNTDNNLKDRTANQGKCKNCGHTFVFEPTTMTDVKITDPFFAKAIADISVENTLFFTPKQLLYFFDRLFKKKKDFSILGLLIFLIPPFILFFPFIYISLLQGSVDIKNNYNVRKKNARALQIVGIAIILIGIILLINYKLFFIYAITTIWGMASIYLGTIRLRNQNPIPQSFLISEYQVQDWLNRWMKVNRNIDKVLPLPREEARQIEVNSEISAYSFDRVVVCDKAEIAQFLIANNFHFENNCAVLSITGYPQNIFQTVLEMLRRNGDLKVYAFHDATPRGVSLVQNLGNSRSWFADSDVTIYDLGISPRQVLNHPHLFIGNSEDSARQAKQLSAEIREQLSTEELDWLESGNFVELENFSPRKLLQIVTQGIALSRAPESDSLSSLDETYIAGGAYIVAVDSFG